MKWIKIIFALAVLASACGVGSAWAFDRGDVSVRGRVYVNPVPLIPIRPNHGHHHNYYNSYPSYGYGPSLSFNYSNGYVNDYSSRYVYRSSPGIIVRTVPEPVYIERTVSPAPTYSSYSSYSTPSYSTPTYYGPSVETRSDAIGPTTNSGAPLYCHNPDGYYPAVKNCPSGWRRVSQ
jgi:hypothetical protein